VREIIELPAQTKQALDELRELSEKAEDGDREARKELRERLLDSTPEVLVRASDVARRAQHMLIDTAAGGSALTEYALSGRLDLMRNEIAGDNPTPLETLLTEQVVSCWMWLQLLDALMSGQFSISEEAKAKRVGVAYLLKMLKIQESAHRRLLASIQALARVRKLQANTPGIQFNTQINVGR
jgi:hypothetical protein